MKRAIFKIIDIIYKTLSKVLKVNDRRIIMECDYGKGFYGNLLCIYREIEKQNLDYEIIIPVNKNVKLFEEFSDNTKVIRTRGLKHFYYLITSKFWITNNHYYFFLTKRKETTCINTWHALGAFKKFALDCDDGQREEHIADGNNTDYLLVSSEKVSEIYSKALNVPMNKIVSLGIPRTDLFFKEDLMNKIQGELREKLNCKDKKVILYAPTFRDGEKYNADVKLDIPYMNESLKDDYVLLIKLHPIIRNKIEIPKGCEDFVRDASSFNMNDLLVMTDVLITDYSSVVFDYALLERPMIFFAYDLDEFKQKSREFYYGYEEFIPDKCVQKTEEVVEKIKSFETNLDNETLERIKVFSKEFCEFRDGKSSERFVKRFLT